MSPYVVRVGSAALLAAAYALASPASAQSQVFTFQGSRIAFNDVLSQPHGAAVAADDAGLASLLNALGATLTWQKGDRYILVTTAEPVVISFALGERTYDVGPEPHEAAFAPFERDGRAYLPLDALFAALDLSPKPDGTQTILQPQLAALELRAGQNGTAKIVAHGGVPLTARTIRQDNAAVVLQLDGVGSTLPAVRTFSDGPVRRIDVQTNGSAVHPQTTVTLHVAPGAPHATVGSDDQRDLTVTFGAPPSGAPANAAAPAQAAGSNVAAPGGTFVTSVQMQPEGPGTILHIALTVPAAWEWHRLRPPDNRWWIDIHGARLTAAPPAIAATGPVQAVRVRQQSAGVRIALSLERYNDVSVTTDARGITVTVGATVASDDAPRAGFSSQGAQSAYATPAPSPNWKFTAPPSPGRYAARNPRLIVIDPGHGGSDVGALGSGLVEKSLTLDMSRRLREILIARGWQVMMTRDGDRDVYAPNDSADDELQARDDVANARGARIFVSIHVNSFINAGPHGVTTFYYKGMDLPLAQAVDRRIAQEVSIKDDGIVRNMYYVVHHAAMPAILVETAFISNPDDAQLLGSPSWRQAMAKAIADGISDYLSGSS